MKKFIFVFFFMIFVLPFVVSAETCNTDKITIENITIENKSDSVEELI